MARQTAAEKAFKAAQAAIAQAAKRGATELRLYGDEFSALGRLPEEIAGLTGLTLLDLPGTGVSDLEPLRGLTGLMRLDLMDTEVSDLEPLRGMLRLTKLDLLGTGVSDLEPLRGLMGLKGLFLSGTGVSDLEPLRGLTGLTALDLSGTAVSDLEPLRGLTGLTRLDLFGTEVSDLEPLRGMTGLTWLDLMNTKVSDLEPLRGMTGLTHFDLSGTGVHRDALKAVLRGKTSLIQPEEQDTKSGHLGVHLKECRAAREDARIADIAGIEDDRERTIALFEELGLEGREGAEETALPKSGAAPLETEVRDERLVRAAGGEPPLPPGGVQDRARKGWDAISGARKEMVASVNLANYRPLAAAVGALERALGERFEDMNEIGVGIAGQRLSALSLDAGFMATLPDGAGAEVTSLAATIATFANRFPEWLAYLADADSGAPVAAKVQETLAAFDALARDLECAEEVDRDVALDFRDQVEWARSAPTSEVAAAGLLASTRELLRTLAENALIGARLYGEGFEEGARSAGRRIAHELREYGKLAPSEIRKKTFWFVLGVSGDILFLKGGILMSLARQFPERLGWIEEVLRYFAVI